jgi:hypothetical protein
MISVSENFRVESEWFVFFLFFFLINKIFTMFTQSQKIRNPTKKKYLLKQINKIFNEVSWRMRTSSVHRT